MARASLPLLWVLSATEIFWVRTRFWLPRFAHVLAAIGPAMGAWRVYTTSDDPPIHKHGPAGLADEFLFALALPATVNFFFEFYGGQEASIRSNHKLPRTLRILSTVS